MTTIQEKDIQTKDFSSMYQLLEQSTGEKYLIKGRDTQISIQGMRAIRELVAIFAVRRDVADIYVPYPLSPFEWTWKGTNPSCKYQGKFPKRIGNWLHKEWDIDLTTSEKTEIGNLARLHAEPSEDFLFDFTRYIDWDDGDFGDGNSCYFNGSDFSAAIPMIEENGFAIRFYKVHGGGWARGWIVPDCPEVNHAVSFNNYGIWNTHLANVFSRWLSLVMGKTVDYVQCSLGGPQEIYVNGGSTRMYDLLDQIEQHGSRPCCSINWY